MGKKLRQQRRGKGSNAYRKPPNYFKADVMFSTKVSVTGIQGEVIEFIDDPGHSAPLMRIIYEDGTENMLLAPEGIKVGDRIQEGTSPASTSGTCCLSQTFRTGCRSTTSSAARATGEDW